MDYLPGNSRGGSLRSHTLPDEGQFPGLGAAGCPRALDGNVRTRQWILCLLISWKVSLRSCPFWKCWLDDPPWLSHRKPKAFLPSVGKHHFFTIRSCHFPQRQKVRRLILAVEGERFLLKNWSGIILIEGESSLISSIMLLGQWNLKLVPRPFLTPVLELAELWWW